MPLPGSRFRRARPSLSRGSLHLAEARDVSEGLSVRAPAPQRSSRSERARLPRPLLQGRRQRRACVLLDLSLQRSRLLSSTVTSHVGCSCGLASSL